MSYIALGVILFTVALSAVAQLFFKMGVGQPGVARALERLSLEALTAVASSPLILAGLALYGLSVALWLWVLSRVDLSLAYPFVGLSFLVVMGFGALFLGESVGPLRLVGTVLIAAGCILVVRSA